MTEVPKIVHHRLRAATPAPEMLEQMHPDADLLTAFAEQALAAPDREGVLLHLALCGDCRDVVALALPEIDSATPPMEENERVVERTAAGYKENKFSWARFNWGYLRWATLAAGIAVAVFVVRPAFEHSGKQRTAVNSAANQTSPAAQPAPASQIASGASPENSAATKNAGTSAETSAEKTVAPNAANTITADRKIANSIVVPRGIPGPSPEPPFGAAPTSTQSGMRLAGNMAGVGGAKQSAGSVKKDSVSVDTGAAPNLEFRAPEIGR